MVTYQQGRGDLIIRHNDNGTRSEFHPDPTSADYQEYLAWEAQPGNDAAPAAPEPEPETPPASILRLLLADVEDVDETKPILDAMLIILGG